MKQLIEQNLTFAVSRFLDDRKLQIDKRPVIAIDHARDNQHGDLATNIAMLLAKPAGLPPRVIAEGIRTFFPATQGLEKIEIAGPGFINFFLTKTAYLQIIPDILSAGLNYGKSTAGEGRKILLEYVSSNPTGPLHIGHGRGAAYGSVLANLMQIAGYDVTSEYYVNDAGRQMDILAVSVWLRLLQHSDYPDLGFPSNAYQGKYIEQIANDFISTGTALPKADIKALSILLTLSIDEDKKLDQIIAYTRSTLGVKPYETLFDFTLGRILAEIKQDLLEFGVNFNN